MNTPDEYFDPTPEFAGFTVTRSDPRFRDGRNTRNSRRARRSSVAKSRRRRLDLDGPTARLSARDAAQIAPAIHYLFAHARTNGLRLLPESERIFSEIVELAGQVREVSAWLTVTEASRMLGMSEEYVRRLCREDRFHGVDNSTGQWLIPRNAVFDHLEGRTSRDHYQPEHGPAEEQPAPRDARGYQPHMTKWSDPTGNEAVARVRRNRRPGG